MAQNAEDGGNRKWICVQLPEATANESEAYKAGYKTIADIAKERIRRVIRGYGDKAPLGGGFKAFSLAESNYRANQFAFDPARGVEENEAAFEEYLGLMGEDSLFDGAKDEDVLYECIIKEGFPLTSVIEEVALAKNKAYKVSHGERTMLVCLDRALHDETVTHLRRDEYKSAVFICIDSATTDTQKANLSFNVELKTI